ncbi:MAG: molybdate ABC transporter substrate-binding protein [Lentisphaeria bacterium]|nr:molybdate ABC transporter substrate-binding protein [Lentisphaeria bacterium]
MLYTCTMTVVVMLVAEDKAGACPVQDARTLCAHQCKVDTHCQGDKKCCSAGGCNVCASPAPPAGGSGAMLNQMRMEQIGDVYLPGSNDYMDVAERDGLVQPQTRRIICYLIPAICVAKGNPRSIAALPDLAQPKLKVSIGDPGSVCLGTIARTLLRDAGVLESVTKNIVTYASDCQQLATLVRLQEVDAIIGYDVFTRQSPKQMDLVPIPNAKALHIPVAVGRYSKASETAMRFVTYISSAKGKKVFAKYGYALTAN